jgi:hypothetical protein
LERRLKKGRIFSTKEFLYITSIVLINKIKSERDAKASDTSVLIYTSRFVDFMINKYALTISGYNAA